jgi:selT/selW/selH-like putative selenoprotein
MLISVPCNFWYLLALDNNVYQSLYFFRVYIYIIKMSQIKINVIYCGGCGYASKFRLLKKNLELIYRDKLNVTGEATPNTSGWFEVTVGSVLTHSKRNGDGYIDNDAKMLKVTTEIDRQL